MNVRVSWGVPLHCAQGAGGGISIQETRGGSTAGMRK